MRRFSSAITRRNTRDHEPPKPRDDAVASASADLVDESNFVLITPEDGDLQQEPKTLYRPALRDVPPVFIDLRYPPEIQEELRWRRLCQDMGFEQLDDALPTGFEDFDWSHVFPPDREHVALMAETAVAKGEDPQAVIDAHAEPMALRAQS